MIIEKLKADTLRLRKERSPLAIFASTVLGQAQTLAKAETKDGVSPEVNDDFALRSIRSFSKTAEENIQLKSERNTDFSKDQAELDLLKSWLPQMVSEDDIKAVIQAQLATLEKSPKAMGVIMKALKEQFGASMDPAVASKLTREALV